MGSSSSSSSRDWDQLEMCLGKIEGVKIWVCRVRLRLTISIIIKVQQLFNLNKFITTHHFKIEHSIRRMMIWWWCQKGINKWIVIIYRLLDLVHQHLWPQLIVIRSIIIIITIRCHWRINCTCLRVNTRTVVVLKEQIDNNDDDVWYIYL